MFKPLLIAILALAVVAAVVFVGGKYWGNKAPDETANWNTFHSAAFDYTFRYPSNYIVKEINTTVQVRELSDINTQALVQFYGEKTNTPLNTIIQDKTDGRVLSGARTTTINGIQAYEGVDQGIVNSYGVYLKNDSNFVEITFGRTDGDDLQQSKSKLTDTQKLILSTFKFTKSVSIEKEPTIVDSPTNGKQQQEQKSITKKAAVSDCPSNQYLTADNTCRNKSLGKTFKLLVVEFVPKNIKYVSFHFCSDGRITHSADGINYSKYPNCSSLESHNFLEVINNPRPIFFAPVPLSSAQNAINPRSYSYINEYLQKEALKYNFSGSPWFNIDIKGPFTLDACAPTVGTAGSVLADQNFFKRKMQDLNIQTSNYDFVAVTYIDDYGLSLDNCPRYANEALVGDKYVFTAIDGAGVGNEYHIQSLTHELLHLFGASDTYVPSRNAGGPDWCYIANGCPSDPEGIPEPNKYPQTKGCLMGPEGAIVLTKGTNAIAPVSMNQVVVCQKTAQEIGWTK